MNTPLHSQRRTMQGVGLIELMVSILIGSFVLAGVMAITSGTSSIGRRSDALGGLTDSGQTALQLLANDVRMAGYSLPRTYYAAGYVTKMLPTTGIRGCDSGFADNQAANINALACKAGTSTSGAAVSIAYEADSFNTILDSTGIPTDCRGTGLKALSGLNGNVPRPDVAVDTMDATAYWLVENRYYIANSGPDNEPTLMCSGNGGVKPFDQGQPLVRGVERMVVTYGVSKGDPRADRNPDVVVIDNPSVAGYMTADAIDNYVDWLGQSSNVRWQRVVSVRMCLEVRGNVGSADDSTTYLNCDGTSKDITDKRARRTVRMTINLRNRTMSVDKDQGLGLGGV